MDGQADISQEAHGSYLSNAVLAEDRPLTGCLQLLYLAQSSNWGKPCPLHPCWGSQTLSAPVPSLFSSPSTQKGHTTAEQGPQGSTGRMEEGRNSKFVWGIQRKENYQKVDGRGKDCNLRAAGCWFIQQPGKIHKLDSYQFKCSLLTLIFFKMEWVAFFIRKIKLQCTKNIGQMFVTNLLHK